MKRWLSQSKQEVCENDKKKSSLKEGIQLFEEQHILPRRKEMKMKRKHIMMRPRWNWENKCGSNLNE